MDVPDTVGSAIAPIGAVTLVDAREDVDGGLAMLRGRSAHIGEGRAVLVVLNRDDADRLGDFRQAGATHFLCSPHADAELVEAIRFAEAGARLAAGGWIRDGDRGRRTRSVATLARELPGAMEAGQIDVLFQPQVAFATGSIVGAEALARWRHPRLGEVGAEALLAAAARAGLGPALSSHIHQCALGLAAGWPQALDAVALSVNVTAGDLAADGFAGGLLARIDAAGFSRARVTVEITEHDLVESLEEAADALRAVREAGCRVALDDFGTGYSSLAYLNALPLDTIKLDRTLTRQAEGSGRDRIIVRGVIAMARSLGLSVIVEGIETEAQRATFADLGCDLYQGYLCAPPVDSATLAEIVRRPRG